MGKMTEKELKAFGNGFRAGMTSTYAVLDDIKKKYFFIRKWIWVAFMTVSAIESGVLIWHLLGK
jgi:hypothetical protein